MLARCDAASNAIAESEVERMRIVRCWGPGSPGFEGTSHMVDSPYGDTVDDVDPVKAGDVVSSLVEDDHY